MIISPIIPIWLMLIGCIGFGFFIVKNKCHWKIKIAIVILLFVIDLRIKIPSNDVKVMSSNLDVLFVIDNTISMVAEDYNGNTPRMEAVRDDCEYIMEELSGARFAVITFRHDSQILVPYTNDSDMALEAIDALKIADEYYSRGSSPNDVIDEMKKVLNGSKNKSDRKQIVFFISDGEITNGDKLSSFQELKKLIDGGAVLGYGTESGGYMKVIDSYTNREKYMYDETSSLYPYPKAVSKIDQGNLKKIANDIGVQYIYMSNQSNLKENLKDIKESFEKGIGTSSISSYIDIYYIFTIPLILLLVYEFIDYKRKLI